MGEIKTTPQYIVTAEPTTNKIEKVTFTINFGSPSTVTVNFNLVSIGGTVLKRHSFDIDGAEFTALFDGIGSTLNSRIESNIWSYVQDNYDTQATP